MDEEEVRLKDNSNSIFHGQREWMNGTAGKSNSCSGSSISFSNRQLSPVAPKDKCDMEEHPKVRITINDPEHVENV